MASGAAKVVLENEEYDPTNPASRDAACIAATEDDKAFVVVNANTLTGTGPICVAGDHKTPLVYVGGAPDSAYRSTNGRLASYGPSADGQLRLLAGDLVATGALKGKKVAVVATDLPDQADVIQRALVDPLKKAKANVVVYDVMPCQGNIVCTQPIPQSVMKVANAKPDVVLPILTATTLPAYVNEMKRAGLTTKLYESSYNALGTDLVQSKVLQVGGKEVADYYKGATLVSATVAGDWSTQDLDLLVTDRRCLDSAYWGPVRAAHVEVVIHRGDETDPLAGVARLRAAGEPPLDVVVGKPRWHSEVIERAVPAQVEGIEVPAARAADLILLKLYAGGPQDAWDITQLLTSPDRSLLAAEVNARVRDLPPDARALWTRIIEADQRP